MELVRAYVALGFKEQRSIRPQDVNRIVDWYLKGEDMQKIAREEAKRIRDEFRVQAHDQDEELEDAYDIERSIRRPPLREAGIPEGYERKSSGIIAPIETPPTIDELGKKVESLEIWAHNTKELFKLMALVLIGVNIWVGFASPKLPWGFITMVPFLLSFWLYRMKDGQYHKQKHKLENAQIERLMEDARGNEIRGRGTVQVTR